MSIIPIIGIVGSFVAFIPIVGMFVHWVLFFLLVFFIFIVLSAPTYIRNKDAKVIYTQYKDDHSNNGKRTMSLNRASSFSLLTVYKYEI